MKVSANKVMLTGTVPSYRALNAAAEDAWNIVGVKDVDNLLTVRFLSTFIPPTDEQIKDNAKNTLLRDADVNSIDIDISVVGGVVTLKSTVAAYWTKYKAEHLISYLNGVFDVENKLAVAPTESFIDKDIAQDIENAIDRNIDLNAEDITVKVEDGKVTLTGRAPTFYAKRKAYEIALFTMGVVDVQSNLLFA